MQPEGDTTAVAIAAGGLSTVGLPTLSVSRSVPAAVKPADGSVPVRRRAGVMNGCCHMLLLFTAASLFARNTHHDDRGMRTR